MITKKIVCGLSGVMAAGLLQSQVAMAGTATVTATLPDEQQLTLSVQVTGSCDRLRIRSLVTDTDANALSKSGIIKSVTDVDDETLTFTVTGVPPVDHDSDAVQINFKPVCVTGRRARNGSTIAIPLLCADPSETNVSTVRGLIGLLKSRLKGLSGR